MELRIEVKELDGTTIVILLDGQVWKEVDKSLFIRELKRIPRKMTREEFYTYYKEIEMRSAKGLSLRMLAKKGYLSGELRDKLIQRKLSSSAVEAAIAYCRESGYLDDEERMRILLEREQRRGLGKKVIFYKLKQKKGVDLEKLEGMLEEGASEQEVLREQLKKWANKIDLSDRNLREKLIAKCMRRGFSYSEIIKALQSGFEH